MTRRVLWSTVGACVALALVATALVASQSAGSLPPLAGPQAARRARAEVEEEKDSATESSAPFATTSEAAMVAPP